MRGICPHCIKIIERLDKSERKRIEKAFADEKIKISESLKQQIKNSKFHDKGVQK